MRTRFLDDTVSEISEVGADSRQTPESSRGLLAPDRLSRSSVRAHDESAETMIVGAVALHNCSTRYSGTEAMLLDASRKSGSRVTIG